MSGIIPKQASNRQIIDNLSRQRYLAIRGIRSIFVRATRSVPPHSSVRGRDRPHGAVGPPPLTITEIRENV